MSSLGTGLKTILSAVALLGGTSVPLLAQSIEPTYGHASPEEARSALNREQADAAQRQLAENAASQQAFLDAQAAREVQIAADRQRYEQEVARIAAEHEAAMERWRADTVACNAGDRTRCLRR